MTAPSAEIQIVVDNEAGDGLLAEHGLAVLLREGERTLLLDTGQGPALARNVEALGIDLSSVDTLVLSHGHFDHTGGVPTVTRLRPDIEAYFHAGILLPRFTVDDRGVRSIGIPAESAEAIERLDGSRLHLVTTREMIDEKMGVTTSIERVTDFEDTGGPFYLDAAGRNPDPIEDDLALWIRTGEGLVVIVGCCHAGIVNTLRRVRRDAGEAKVRAVIGGLHLLHATADRLDSTMRSLETVDPELFVPCHCSGEAALAALRSTFGSRVVPGRSGSVFRF